MEQTIYQRLKLQKEDVISLGFYLGIGIFLFQLACGIIIGLLWLIWYAITIF